MIRNFILSAAIFLFSIVAFSQVTIGIDESAAGGALLQLKNISGTDGGQANSLKGLLLPRVELQNVNTIAGTISGVTAENSQAHTALTVYNLNKCTAGNGNDDGIYVWNGNEWLPLKQVNSPAYTFTDARDNSVYLASSFGEAGDWMVQNLRYHDATMQLSDSNDGVNEKRYFYPNGSTGNTYGNPPNGWTEDQGLLYSWTAATNGLNASTDNQAQGQAAAGPSNLQGICPAGWHLPNDEEWNQLERVIYTNTTEYTFLTQSQRNTFNPSEWNTAWETTEGERGSSSQIGHGNALLAACTPINPGSGAQDDYYYIESNYSKSAALGGFAALFTGSASKAYSFGYSDSVYFWTSSSHDNSNSWLRNIYSFIQKNQINRSYNSRENLASVRCKKDPIPAGG